MTTDESPTKRQGSKNQQLPSSKLSLTLNNENIRSAFLRVSGNASIAGELSIVVDATEFSNDSDVTVVTAASIQGSFSKISVRHDTDKHCKYEARQQSKASGAIQVRLEQRSCNKRSNNRDRIRIITFVVGLVVIVLAVSVCVLICLFKKGKLECCCKKDA